MTRLEVDPTNTVLYNMLIKCNQQCYRCITVSLSVDLLEVDLSGINTSQSTIGKAWNSSASLKWNNPQVILHIHDLSVGIGQNPSIAGVNDIVKGESYGKCWRVQEINQRRFTGYPRTTVDSWYLNIVSWALIEAVYSHLQIVCTNSTVQERLDHRKIELLDTMIHGPRNQRMYLIKLLSVVSSVE